MRHSVSIRLMAAILATVLLGACGGASPTTAPPAVDPTTAPTADAAPATPLGLFTGRAECEGVDPPAGSPDAMYVNCEITASDPRMSGSRTGSGLGDIGEEFATIAGSWTMIKDGGTWQCTELLLGSVGNGTGMADSVCHGGGLYMGLTAYSHWITANATQTWGIVGWIEEAD